MTFDYASYIGLLRRLWAKGYRFTDYRGYAEVERPCVLRHDVDFSPEKAVEMARAEAELVLDGCTGVRATYFLMMNTDFYNLFSAANRRRVQTLIELKHHIGLHFDDAPYACGDDRQALCQKIAEERDALQNIAGVRVEAVSMHRPSQALLKMDVAVPDMVNAYGHLFFQEFKYFSDSRKHWKEDVEEAVESARYRRLQILTHPIWYGQRDEGIDAILKRFITAASLSRYEQLDANIRELDQLVKREEVEPCLR